MKNNKIRYILTIIVQILIIILHIIGTFFAFSQEAIVLEPQKYIILLGGTLLCADIICVVVIFKNTFKKSSAEDNAR